MKTHHAAIEGTHGGPYKPTPAYVSTRKGDTIYVHVLRWNDEAITLPALPRHIRSSRLLGGDGPARVDQSANGVIIQVPAAARDTADTVVALRLDGSAMDIPAINPVPPTLQATLSASNVFQNDPNYAAFKAFDDDEGSRWATDSGTKQAWLQADFAAPSRIQGVSIEEAYAGRVQKFEIQYKAPGRTNWITLVTGTHLGETYKARFAPVLAQSMRLNILDATDAPTIAEIAFQTGR